MSRPFRVRAVSESFAFALPPRHPLSSRFLPRHFVMFWFRFLSFLLRFRFSSFLVFGFVPSASVPRRPYTLLTLPPLRADMLFGKQ